MFEEATLSIRNIYSPFKSDLITLQPFEWELFASGELKKCQFTHFIQCFVNEIVDGSDSMNAYRVRESPWRMSQDLIQVLITYLGFIQIIYCHFLIHGY